MSNSDGLEYQAADGEPKTTGDWGDESEVAIPETLDPEKIDADTSPLGGEPFLPLETEEEIQNRRALVLRAKNPLLEAAAPLLLALASIPESMSEYAVTAYKELLIQEVKTFQAIAESVNIRRDHVVAASYCLCTALDEAVHKKEWGHSSDWAQYGLLVTLHGEGYGGEKVFLLAGRLSSQPLEHFNILELIYRLLSLGFEGRYTVLENGKAKLAALREQLFLIITEKAQVPTRELSSSWAGQKTKEFRQLRRLPWWVTAAIALCIAVAVYHWHLRNNESYRSVVENQISSLSTKTLTTGAVLAQTLRIESLLQDEIQKGLVSVESTEHGTGVTIKGDGLFLPGGEDVMSAMYPLLDKIAVEVSKVKGRVKIVGHTDNLPINTPKFPSNFELSKQRAQVVANRFVLLGVDRSRIEVRGDGDENPVADNTSYIGRAKNRRVEIFVNEEK